MSLRRILFFDFDDTLYSHVLGQVPLLVRERLSRLNRTEDLLVVATGRGSESLGFIQKALGFLPPVMALLNGQVILADGVQVYERFIELPSMDNIIEKAAGHGFAAGGDSKEGEVVNCLNKRVNAVWARFGCPPPHVIPEFQKGLSLYQGHLYITEEEAPLFEPELGEYVTNWSDRYLMNLIPRQAGKASAVRWCMERWGCSREQTYGFGDGFNDVDMLLAVGHGVAVGEQNPELTSAAELVVPPAARGGLLSALEHYGI